MFNQDHHQRIAQVLGAIHHHRLLALQCVFGGGTAIALAHGEYRESTNVDFMCSSPEAMRTVRNLVDREGIQALFSDRVELARDVKANPYGIRCAIRVDGVPIKFELIHEARIVLDDPLDQDRICGVWRATRTDLVATKLLANVDRWNDAGATSRDLIDLVALADNGVLDHAGVDKARHAYGEVVDRSFNKAKAYLVANPGVLAQRMSAMRMEAGAAHMLEKIKALRLGGPPGAARKTTQL